tara:strand:+ start:406 stop:510 length:105 start_codon:yes stop_codon:yes gene_type:complete
MNPSKKKAIIGVKSIPALCSGRISLSGFKIISVS